MVKQYLYAATIHEIQKFIFATDSLKEIGGASELVEQICTQKLPVLLGENYKKEQLLIGAAGNIRYIFDEKEKSLCEKVVKQLPFEVAEMAADIKISQTVITIDGEMEEEHLAKVDRQLNIQRNLMTQAHTLSWMIAKRNPNTGLASIQELKEGAIDISGKQKVVANSQSKQSLFKKMIPKENRAVVKEPTQFASEFEHIAIDNHHSWIAVVHIDGNDLGKIIPTIFKNLKGAALVDKQRLFSAKLDACTQEAAREALNKEVLQKFCKEEIIPIRPAICGGDDFTAIVPASVALDFTKIYLQEFEKQTCKELGGLGGKLIKGLTACAGIAYITQKYPFHYGIHLAESLCKYSKNEAKKLNKNASSGLTPSCLSFYKIESSYAKDYEDILQDELHSPIIGSLSNCPYYLETKEKATIEDLTSYLTSVRSDPHLATRLRQILSMLHTQNSSFIKMELDRIEALNKDALNSFNINKEDLKTLSHLHDILSLNSFI